MKANSDQSAKALWITEAERPEVRDATVGDVPGGVRIRTLYSGISRGTERLVFREQVPPSEFDTLCAPFQEGSFDFPIKYGYATVGIVQSAPREGEVVFALHPHQTQFSVPTQVAIPINPLVPPERAVLAANMETALNIVWDSSICAANKATIVGGGIIGALTGYLSLGFQELKCVWLTPTRTGQVLRKTLAVILHNRMQCLLIRTWCSTARQPQPGWRPQ